MVTKQDNAVIVEKVHCKKCGWPIIETVNGLWMWDWDWWRYCSNKSCENHEGGGIFQGELEWVKEEKEESEE